MGNHTSDHSSRCTVLEVDMQEWLLKCGLGSDTEAAGRAAVVETGVEVDEYEWVVTRRQQEGLCGWKWPRSGTRSMLLMTIKLYTACTN